MPCRHAVRAGAALIPGPSCRGDANDVILKPRDASDEKSATTKHLSNSETPKLESPIYQILFLPVTTRVYQAISTPTVGSVGPKSSWYCTNHILEAVKREGRTEMTTSPEQRGARVAVVQYTYLFQCQSKVTPRNNL